MCIIFLAFAINRSGIVITHLLEASENHSPSNKALFYPSLGNSTGRKATHRNQCGDITLCRPTANI